MNTEKKNFLLFQLKPLKKLEEVKLKEQGKKEKYIEDIFVKNLEEIFPNLIILKSQCYLKHPTQERSCIIDTLAFNKIDNSFLIIEYKREKTIELFYQVREYMECLEEGDDRIFFRNRNKLLRLLDNNDLTKKNNKYWEEEEVNWEKTKGLCIVNEIYGRFPQSEMNNEKIKLAKITFYDNGILCIDIEKITGWLSTEKKQKNNIILSKNDKIDYPQSIEEITKLEWISSNVKKWLAKIDNSLNHFFSKSNSLIKEINAKNENYYPVINYKHKKKILSSVVVKVSQINVYWNFKKVNELSANLLELLNRYRLEYKEQNHRGTGDWQFSLINSDDNCQRLEKFIQELQNVLKLD